MGLLKIWDFGSQSNLRQTKIGFLFSGYSKRRLVTHHFFVKNGHFWKKAILFCLRNCHFGKKVGSFFVNLWDFINFSENSRNHLQTAKKTPFLTQKKTEITAKLDFEDSLKSVLQVENGFLECVKKCQNHRFWKFLIWCDFGIFWLVLKIHFLLVKRILINL